jgi:hypothetical protein
MKTKSKRGKEHASIWIRRIEAFNRTIDEVWEARQKYRQAISLKCGDGGPWGSVGDTLNRKRVNYSHRYLRWLKAQGTGERPVIEYPRDAEGDETYAEMAELVLGRVLDEGRATEEWRDTYADKCWLGCSTVWYGFHAEVLTAEEAHGAAEGAGDRLDRAMDGDLAPNPGQDHDAAATGLRAVVEEQAAELGSQGREALIAAAQAHDKAAEDEEAAGENVRVQKRKIWFKRGLPGVDTFWDPFCTDLSDAEYMMQRVLMRVEDAQEYKGFGPARKRLEGKVMGKGNEKDGREVVNADGVPGGENETKRVVIYIIWDKRHKTRHFISPELPNEYLEADEQNPYIDAQGRDVIPDFFPCAYSAPELAPVEGPTRTFGMPLVATGWAQEEDANTFADLMVAAAKRHSARQYVVNRSITKDTSAIQSALESGKDGIVIEVDVPPEQTDKVIFPLAFRGTGGEVEGQARWAKQQWVENIGMPNVELSSQATAKTLGQEEMGVTAGRMESDLIIKIDEQAFAKMIEGVRGLVRAFYPEEKIVELLGPTWAAKYSEWVSTPICGDTMSVKFGPRARSEENVKLNLSMKAFELAQNYTGVLGLPIKDIRPLIEEIFRKLGHGTPKDVAPAEMQLRELVQHLSTQVEELQQENQELAKQSSQQGGSTEKRGPKSKRRSAGSGGASSDSLSTAARRT